jgi:hypothetical protein
LLSEHAPECAPEPILAWRIGKDSECDCVLPVTCTGTHGSQTYVLRPDGKVSWNAVSYGGAAPEYKSLADWHDDVTGQNETGRTRDKGLKDDAKIQDAEAEVKAAYQALTDAQNRAAKADSDAYRIREAKAELRELTGQDEPSKKKLRPAKRDRGIIDGDIPF